MSFYTSRLLFLALLLACVSCAGSADGTLIEYVGLDGSVVECTDGEIEVTTLTGCFRAVRVPRATQSVKFKVNGEVTAVENQPPYHSYKDQQGKPNVRLHREASYIVAAVPYTQNGGRGRALAGANIRVRFKLKDDPAPDPEPEPPGPDPEPDPDPEPEPDPPTPPGPTPASGVFGDFILQPLFHSDNNRVPPFGSRLIDESELRKPGVDGLTIRIIPNTLKNGDYSFVQQCVQRCRNTGDRYKLLVAGGGSNPLAESNLQAYEAIARELGRRYATDPHCVGAHVAGTAPSGHSEELFWGRPMPREAINATKRMIDAWTAAFPNQVKLLAGSANDPAAMRELIDYGIQRTGGRFLYKNNAMSAKASIPWQGNRLVVYCGQRGGMIGWEMVGSWTLERTRFGGSYQEMVNKVNQLTAEAGKPKGHRMLDHYPPDIDLVPLAK